MNFLFHLSFFSLSIDFCRKCDKNQFSIRNTAVKTLKVISKFLLNNCLKVFQQFCNFCYLSWNIRYWSWNFCYINGNFIRLSRNEKC